jgi:hypothetical protein
MEFERAGDTNPVNVDPLLSRPTPPLKEDLHDRGYA